MAPTAIYNDATSDSGKPRILVPEKVSPDGLSMLSSLYDVDIKIGLSPKELVKIIPSYHGLIVRSETKVTAEVLAVARKLRVVARAGVGVDNIDLAQATKQGVIVVNSPSGNILAAAEMTISLLLATARNVGRADRTLKDGTWQRNKLVGVEVATKTLGIIGLGKVGLNVARMAGGLAMKVIAMDPYASPDVAAKYGVQLVPSLEDLLPAVDFLTIHTPLIASTLDMIGEKQLQSMKKTARVLNVARGGVYNEEALIKALDEGWIAGAGIDVFTSEPPTPGSSAFRLAQNEKVVATPHLGASTKEAQENVSLDVCAQVREILRGGMPTAAVNAPLLVPEEWKKLQPFVSLVEKMGSLYTQHFWGSKGSMIGGRHFELEYTGELANMTNTRPLFAALVKGLVSTISDAQGADINIVNATIVSKERGITINEKHIHDVKDLVYSSLVRLKSFNEEDNKEQRIEGYISGKAMYVSRLDRFTSNFTPAGNLIIIHNHDEAGKIGLVGMALGRHKINIRFMHVAPSDGEDNEALMLLGVEQDVTHEVLDELVNWTETRKPSHI